MPIYTMITEGVDDITSRAVARRAVLAAFVGILSFALTGKFIFSFFNVSVDGLKVVGGFLFFVMGYDMLQGKEARVKTVSVAEKMSLHDAMIKAITPLAIPVICGPGTITVITVMMQETKGTVDRLALLLATVLVCLICYFVLIGSKRIMKVLGDSGQKVFFRLMGLIVMMIAVEFFFNGIAPYIKRLGL